MSTNAEILLENLTRFPQKARELIEITGMHNGSELREAVHELRLSGYPVCSRTDKGGGYWLGNDADRQRTLADLKSRMREIGDVICAMERGPLDGQMEVRR